MKTLPALLIVLLLTSPVMAQDDDVILICLRDTDEECPCIPDVPHTCPDDEPEQVEPVRVVTTVTVYPRYQPSVESVQIESDERGWCYVELFSDGHWWRVVDNAHPDGIRVYSDGHAELIADDPDPTHYQLTDCNAP